MEGRRLYGILIDRDTVVRVLTTERDPAAVRVGEIGGRDLSTISPTASLGAAARRIRQKAMRWLPVVEDDWTVVGIVSLRDLAAARAGLSTHSRVRARWAGPYEREPLGVFPDRSHDIGDMLHEALLVGDEVVRREYNHDRPGVEPLDIVGREEDSGGSALALGLNQNAAKRRAVEGLGEISLLARQGDDEGALGGHRQADAIERLAKQ